MKETILGVLVTAPDEEQGARMARALVEESLAACVNMIPGIRSVYRWRGEVCEDSEVLLWIKTRKALFPRILERVRELHPYEVPEIVSLSIDEGLPQYLEWVAEETARE
jgi:periplasmic divalent cation tolerance protein